MADLDQQWWRASKQGRAVGGGAGQVARDYVRRIEQTQGDKFDLFFKLEILYDPNNSNAEEAGVKLDHVQENIIASNVDTVHAAIATTEILPGFDTDGGDWGQQRRAKHLEWYAEDLMKDLDILPRCRSAFKEAAKKGTGLTKSHIVFDEPRVDQVLIENIVVDDAECRGGRAPRQIHEWAYIDADELAARFPKYEKEIENARKTRKNWRQWRFGTVIDNDVEVLHSYRLPIGRKGGTGYKAGRYVLSIDGTDLFDVKWEEDFPYAIIVWSERLESLYGISGAERIAGIQAALNRRNWQIERQLDQGALPTTYVRPADANIMVKSSRVGAIVPIKGDYPQTVTPPAVSGETYQSRIDLREAGNNEFGQSQMATHATKPAGIDSGVALREYKDQTTQRFATQEKGFEDLVLDTVTNSLRCCKALGSKAPTITRHGRFGGKSLTWAKVDLREMKVQISARSNLNRSRAGREQMVIEFAQAGIISQDQAKRLLGHPDIESEMSLYTAALETIEYCLDEIADGQVVMPEPYFNLLMCVWRAQAEYQKWLVSGAPEDVLENLRSFIVQAAYFQAPAANQNVSADAAMAADPAAAAMPPGAAPAPTEAPPQAAFSPQAMALRAG